MSEKRSNPANDGPREKFLGLLAQFDDQDSLVAACDAARQAGYRKMDAYSPFPVHGIDPAIGIKRTYLPFFVLAVGLSALGFALFLQWYANSADWSPLFPGYGFLISGKPLFSLPANIPVTFEIIVLSSAFATFFGMWIRNALPRLANPLHRISRFSRATNDRFFLMIEEKDENFNRQATEGQLNDWGATAIEEVNQDLTDGTIPKNIKLIAALLAMLLLVPPVMIFRAMGKTSRDTRLHVIPDMDFQEKSKTQTISPRVSGHEYLFSHLSAMQPDIPGTVARGHLEIDTEYYRGYVKGTMPGEDDHDHDHASRRSVGVADMRVGLENEPATSSEAKPVAPSFGEGGDVAYVAAHAEEDGEPQWVTYFPPHPDRPDEPVVTMEQLERGKERFDIYCAACHGYSGNGDGLVNQKALNLNASGKAAWTAAKSLHDPEVKKNAPGRIFDTITNGRSTMGPYRSQIPVEDRWAIVMYVKALQQTGIEPPGNAVAVGQTSADAANDGAGETTETAEGDTEAPQPAEVEPAEPGSDGSDDAGEDGTDPVAEADADADSETATDDTSDPPMIEAPEDNEE